ncbi:Na(+)/H(+) antiporter subunit C [Nesterenkonia flava]|uniref:Na(+)/H(+) antiporter subunit C n=1 Tax=Nesterenkonia flava TaxID=469799 RepID=A0ABU1FVS8_9MICC|nr:Na(+)/H(+) antiporter subunit C [Nesterenkonia flava]MDR5712780.1 Na(+)/H(+) antiporter subunit C [Nesterenkonia flava]
MTVNLTLLVVMGAMLAIGIYLLLERSLTRVLLGIILISNGVNLLILQTAGRSGDSPIVRGEADPESYLDPLPQALLLTAIVIAFALVSFMLALIYRSWVLARQDEVSDDEEDRRVAEASGAYDPEDDAEVSTETSEFIGAVDPNTGTVRTESAPPTGQLPRVNPESAAPGDRAAERQERRGETP